MITESPGQLDPLVMLNTLKTRNFLNRRKITFPYVKFKQKIVLVNI